MAIWSSINDTAGFGTFLPSQTPILDPPILDPPSRTPPFRPPMPTPHLRPPSYLSFPNLRILSLTSSLRHQYQRFKRQSSNGRATLLIRNDMQLAFCSDYEISHETYKIRPHDFSSRQRDWNIRSWTLINHIRPHARVHDHNIKFKTLNLT